MADDVTQVTVKRYSRTVPHKYKKRKSKSRSIRIDERVYFQIVCLKHGNMTISDVISFLLLQAGTSNMNDAVQPPAPAQTLKQRFELATDK